MTVRSISRGQRPWNKIAHRPKETSRAETRLVHSSPPKKSQNQGVTLQSLTWQSTASFAPATSSDCDWTTFAREAMCGIEQQSSKRREVGRSGSRSQSNRELLLKPGYQRFGRQVPDTFFQVDFMQVLTYPSANMPGWCIAGLKASALCRHFMAHTRCGARKPLRFTGRPATCAQCNSSSAIRSWRAPSDISGLR